MEPQGSKKSQSPKKQLFFTEWAQAELQKLGTWLNDRLAMVATKTIFSSSVAFSSNMPSPGGCFLGQKNILVFFWLFCSILLVIAPSSLSRFSNGFFLKRPRGAQRSKTTFRPCLLEGMELKRSISPKAFHRIWQSSYMMPRHTESYKYVMSK